MKGLNPRSNKQTPKSWKTHNPNDTKEDPIRTKKKQKWMMKEIQKRDCQAYKMRDSRFFTPLGNQRKKQSQTLRTSLVDQVLIFYGSVKRP